MTKFLSVRANFCNFHCGYENTKFALCHIWRKIVLLALLLAMFSRIFCKKNPHTSRNICNIISTVIDYLKRKIVQFEFVVSSKFTKFFPRKRNIRSRRKYVLILLHKDNKLSFHFQISRNNYYYIWISRSFCDFCTL